MSVTKRGKEVLVLEKTRGRRTSFEVRVMDYEVISIGDQVFRRRNLSTDDSDLRWTAVVEKQAPNAALGLYPTAKRARRAATEKAQEIAAAEGGEVVVEGE